MPGTIQQIIHDVPIGTRVIVAGLCMEPDTIISYYGIAKELSIQFVVAYTLEEFANALTAIADGRIDVSPMITATVPFLTACRRHSTRSAIPAITAKSS